MLRALLFGGFWTLAPMPIALLLWPGFFPLTTNQAWAAGACYALAAAIALWTATRLPATSSWPIAIVGWIAGFFLVQFIIDRLIWIVAVLSAR